MFGWFARKRRRELRKRRREVKPRAPRPLPPFDTEPKGSSAEELMRGIDLLLFQGWEADECPADSVEGLVPHALKLCPTGEGMFESAIPIPLQWDEPEEVRTLAAWLYFNPYGPTVVRLSLCPVGRHGLLLLRRRHPFDPYAYAGGIVSEATMSTPDRCADLLRPYFASGDIVGTCMPTSLISDPDFRLSSDAVKDLFWAAAEKIDGADLELSIDLLRKHGTDPWGMATASRDLGLKLAIAESREGEVPQPRKVERSVFEEWWSLVTDERHWAAELAELGNAWRGSIAHARGGFLR